MISDDARRRFHRLVEAGRTFVLTTHMNPDGDGLGSQLALAGHLRGQGKHVRLVNQDPTPRVLRFLEPQDLKVERYDPAVHDPVLLDADLVILLDNSAPDRLGVMESIIRRCADRVLCVDHHPTRETPWRYNVLDQEACATAEVVYELLHGSGTMTPPMAEALFVGIATDTGFFRFNSTTPRAFEIAADLMRRGVEPALCYERIYERNSAAYARLLGHALSGLRLDGDGRVASVSLTLEVVRRCGAEEEDTSEMTTQLLAIEGVRIALLFRETEGGEIKVSLRSKGDLDVRRLAMAFGGGGHRNASGIVLRGSLPEVAENVIRKAVALVEGSEAKP